MFSYYRYLMLYISTYFPGYFLSDCSRQKKSGKEVAAKLAPISHMSYVDAICSCCGEPSHDKSACSRQQLCFICKATSHSFGDSPVLKRPLRVARYIGSAPTSLGFYHIEAPAPQLNLCPLLGIVVW
jgi:hypothetical protein